VEPIPRLHRSLKIQALYIFSDRQIQGFAHINYSRGGVVDTFPETQKRWSLLFIYSYAMFDA